MGNDGRLQQSLWYEPEPDALQIIDQTLLPHSVRIRSLNSLAAICDAINTMQVRGAPLIGVTAAYGVYFALRDNPQSLSSALEALAATRPTAVNLQWALNRVNESLVNVPGGELASRALETAQILEKEDIAACEAIGEQGAALLQKLWQEKSATQSCLNILTHCNAGALATVDWGTALAVVYKTAALDIPVHVWVGETRPRNQGAALTCWELGQRHIPHTLIVDNAGGHLMQQGKVDLCLVGSDRTTRRGDVCNKIGTYLKALAAYDNAIPFYVALPVSSIDFSLQDAIAEIPIEERGAQEVLSVTGCGEDGQQHSVTIAPDTVAVSNAGFDITPARLVTALITEKGVVAANEAGVGSLLDSY